MKVKLVIEKIEENWPAKIVCFVMALFLYIFYQVATLDRRTFTVPLTITAKAGMLPASSYPQTVKITVRGRTEELAAVTDSDLSAYLDLNTCAKEGAVTLPVLVNLSKKAMLIDPFEIHVSPSEVELKVEEQISAYTPVNVLLKGTPAHGYELGDIIITPPEVRISGPRSLVENCKRLQTAAISTQNAAASFSQTVPVENTGSFITLDETKEVSVSVTVVPSKLSKTFESQPVNLIHLQSDLEPLQSVPALDLKLSGNMLDLEQYTPGVFVLLADCSKVTGPGTYDLPLSVVVPDAFTVDGAIPDSVTVTFTEKSTDETKTTQSSDKKKSSGGVL